MRIFRILCCVALQVTCVAASLAGQAGPSRQSIAVFRVSYYGQSLAETTQPQVREIGEGGGSIENRLRGTGRHDYDRLFARALSSVDAQIHDLFAALRRFDVVAMPQRIASTMVGEFVETFADYALKRVDFPESFLFYGEPFTTQDLDRLARQYVAVVPSVTEYHLVEVDAESFDATVETAITFIDISDLRQFGHLSIETVGTGDSPDTAVAEAVSGIADELAVRVQQMPAFQIRSEVAEVIGQQVTLMRGSDYGIRVGDEYAVVANRVQADGSLAATETGLIVINEIREHSSGGTILYATPRVSPGDTLQLIPRRAVELQMYADLVTNALADMTYTVGLRIVPSRGFFEWRPIGAVEMPFRGLADRSILPLSLLVGGEWNSYFGRLRLSPSLSLGVTGAVPLFAEPGVAPVYLSHLGVLAKVAGSVLVTRDIMVNVELGVGRWFGFYDGSNPRLSGPLSTYGGLILGGGVTLK